MNKIANIIFGILFGIAPLLGVGFIGLLIYYYEPSPIGFTIIGVLGLLSVWIGIKIFKKVQIVGPLEFMTTVHASPELDNLKLDSNSDTKERQPEELVSLIENDENLFKGGTIRIFGDWFGKPYDNYHKIDNAEYDNDKKVLILNFGDKERLEIYNPCHIFEVSTFLKIVKADRVRLNWYYFGKEKKKENLYFIDYLIKNKKIETKTNVDWYEPNFDVSINDSALIIYG